MLEGMSCVGGYVLCEAMSCVRLCLVLEGMSCVGGFVLCWRVCLVLEGLSCVGGYVLCWRVCLVLEAMAWLECFHSHFTSIENCTHTVFTVC